MEEKTLLGLGFEKISSSNLQVRGGVSSTFWSNLFTKIKAIVNFIADYVPKFLNGFSDGFGLTIFKQ